MEEKILNIMKETFETEDIDKTCSQENCDKWESMSHLNLILSLEEEFDIKIDPKEISSMKNFNDVVEVVKSKI